MKYLREIDGLRAIAVLSVLFFHAEFGAFSGGFTGVDVFFVISGYLITRIILTDIDAGCFSIRRFYERRIRRIAPALFATLLGCTIFLLILPPVESAPVRDAALAALFSVSNFYFHSTTDYFAGTSFNPVLHTWSLSVEEQFYVVLPPFLLLLSLGSKRLRLGLLGLAALVSLVAAEWVVAADQSAAFYLPWLRAWELAAGSLLSALPLQRIPPRAKVVLTAMGLAAIAAAVFGFDERMRFPGVSALLPVLGSCAVIAGIGVTSPLHALLGSVPMRFIGKISYSLYLIHWPLICFVLSFQTLTFKAQLLVCSLSVGLAWLSWRYIESPFRQPTGVAPPVFRVFAATAAVVLGAVLLAALLGRMLWDSAPDAAQFTRWLNYDRTDPQLAGNPCFPDHGDYRLQDFGGQCLGFEPDRPHVLVLGDSHAAHLMTALRQEHPQVRFLQASSPGCKPLLRPQGLADCHAMMGYLYREWLPRNRAGIRTVLLSAQWKSGDAAALSETLKALSGLGLHSLVIGPTPEFRAKLALILAYEEILGRPLAARFVKPAPFELDRELRAAPGVGPHYYSMTDALCPDGACVTRAGAAPVFFDRDHLTAEGAALALARLPSWVESEPNTP